MQRGVVTLIKSIEDPVIIAFIENRQARFTDSHILDAYLCCISQMRLGPSNCGGFQGTQNSMMSLLFIHNLPSWED